METKIDSKSKLRHHKKKNGWTHIKTQCFGSIVCCSISSFHRTHLCGLVRVQFCDLEKKNVVYAWSQLRGSRVFLRLVTLQAHRSLQGVSHFSSSLSLSPLNLILGFRKSYLNDYFVYYYNFGFSGVCSERVCLGKCSICLQSMGTAITLFWGIITYLLHLRI